MRMSIQESRRCFKVLASCTYTYIHETRGTFILPDAITLGSLHRRTAVCQIRSTCHDYTDQLLQIFMFVLQPCILKRGD